MSKTRIVVFWLLIIALLYFYVILQRGLIVRPAVFVALIVICTLMAFFMSALEAAVLSSGDKNLERKIQALGRLSRNQKKAPEYQVAKRTIVKDLAEISGNRIRYVSPLVIGSNVPNVILTAFLPVSWSADAIRGISVSIPSLGSWMISVPGAGVGTLKFFSSVLLVLVFGKIAPKRLGQAYAFQFLLRFRKVILWLRKYFGWLGDAVTVPVDGVVTRVRRRARK